MDLARSRESWGEEQRIPPGGERGFDALALFLLMLPATAGMWALGSTRVWGYAPGLALSFLGSLLVLVRPWIFRGTPCGRVPPGFWGWAALVLMVAVRVPASAVPIEGRWEALRWACLLAAAWSWMQMGARAHRWKWLLGVLLMAVALAGLYAMVQHVNGSRQVLWMPKPEQYELRASGTYLCPNHFANMLAMLLPLAVVLLFLREAGFPLRLMALYYLAVAAPVLYWTQSRSGWLGALAGVGVTLTLLAWRKSRAWLLAALVALPLLAGAGGWVAWKTLPAVRQRVGAVLEDPEKAGGIRMQMWRDVPAMVRDRPVWGHGGGSFVWIYPPYQVHVKEHLLWDYLHNDYLQLAVEYGLAGLALALGVLAWALAGMVRGVLRARSAEAAGLLAAAGGGLAGSLVHACFDFNFHIFPNPHALVWMGGVAWGVWFSRERGEAPASGRWRGVCRVLGGVAAAGCGCCAWLAVMGGMSYGWNLRGEMARTRLDWEEAERDYRRAMEWDDWNWRPHLGLGNLRAAQALWYRDPDPEAEQAGKRERAEEAMAHFRESLARNPCEMAAEFGLARTLNAAGDPEGALEHLRRAATYQRRHVFYREQLGIQLRRLGRDEEALEVFRRNVADGVASEVSLLNLRALERKAAEKAAAVPLSP